MLTGASPLARARMRAQGVVGRLRRMLLDRVGSEFEATQILPPSPMLQQAMQRPAQQQGETAPSLPCRSKSESEAKVAETDCGPSSNPTEAPSANACAPPCVFLLLYRIGRAILFVNHCQSLAVERRSLDRRTTVMTKQSVQFAEFSPVLYWFCISQALTVSP